MLNWVILSLSRDFGVLNGSHSRPWSSPSTMVRGQRQQAVAEAFLLKDSFAHQSSASCPEFRATGLCGCTNRPWSHGHLTDRHADILTHRHTHRLTYSHKACMNTHEYTYTHPHVDTQLLPHIRAHSQDSQTYTQTVIPTHTCLKNGQFWGNHTF